MGSASAPSDVPAPPATSPRNEADPGLTEAVSAALRSAGVPLTQPEIVERVQRINPRYDSDYVGSMLYRQQRRHGGAIVAAGPKGHRRYSLRSNHFFGRLPGPSLPANDNMLHAELTERILAVLAERPISDYRHLARAVAGADDRDTVRVVRNRVHHLKDAGKLRRRYGDRAWEVPALH